MKKLKKALAWLVMYLALAGTYFVMVTQNASEAAFAALATFVIFGLMSWAVITIVDQ